MEKIVILARLVRDCCRPDGGSCFMRILLYDGDAHPKKPLGSRPVLPDYVDLMAVVSG